MIKGDLLAAALVIAGGLTWSNPNCNETGFFLGLMLIVIPTIVMVLRYLAGSK